jgi:hypothetical protein
MWLHQPTIAKTHVVTSSALQGGCQYLAVKMAARNTEDASTQ